MADLAGYISGVELFYESGGSVGTMVIGQDTTIAGATLAIAIGINGLTNVMTESNTVHIFGDLIVDGTTMIGTVTSPAIPPVPVTTAITNTQIKALPTTPIVLVPAPGAGLTIVPSMILLLSNFTAGAYTNINADGFLFAQFGASAWSSYCANDSGNAVTYLSAFLTNVDHRLVLREYSDTTNPTPQWGPLAVAGTRGDNTALSLTIDNGGSGNLTGGNAANALSVVVTYTIVAVP